jgi:hypothetical protein
LARDSCKASQAVRFGGIELTATVTRGLGKSQCNLPTQPPPLYNEIACLEDKRKFTRARPLVKRLIAGRSKTPLKNTKVMPSRHKTFDMSPSSTNPTCKTTGPISPTARFLRAEAIQRAVASVRSLPGAHRERSLHCLTRTNVARHTSSRRASMSPHTKPLFPLLTTR